MPALLRAAHLGPALAVVALSVLLGVAGGLSAGRLLLVAVTVLTGQLVIGWSNDLLDEARDRAAGRADKPLAAGRVSRSRVRTACAVTLVAAVPLSLACGPVAGLVHLVVVASGLVYNAGLKATVWSWVPYAVAFGSLAGFVALAGEPPRLPPWWIPVAAALLGVGAHLLNALPDLAADEATGVRGLPHRIGRRLLPVSAVSVLTTATAVVVAGTGSTRPASAAGVLVVAVLGALALTGSGRRPFHAAIGIALVDVVLLVTSG
ncbi:MAG: UbiA family prenyltransferase [Phycicoccus sp.]